MNETPDIEEQLAAIQRSSFELLQRCHLRSALQRNREAARLAKGHQQLIPYIYSRFHQMAQAHDVLNPREACECAIELIPLLEDEEAARAFQSDFDDDYYEGARAWMTACLYENLADATGQTEGFNSEGMHQCIADGLQVCRRTGKLACIQCFREYSADVYTAADDITMARHHCEAVLAHTGAWSDRGNRRWYVSTRLSRLELLEGRPDAAVEAAEQAMQLTSADDVSLKHEARLRAMAELDMARIMAGLDRVDWSRPEEVSEDAWLPPDGEWPVLELKRQLNDALADACQGRYETAIATLTDCDRLLFQNHCLTQWFDVRLRLIATLKLAGRHDRTERLSAQLKERAARANDFLTLRRLQRLADNDAVLSPFAAVADMNSGPFASAGKTFAAAGVPLSDETSQPESSARDESVQKADDADQPAVDDAFINSVFPCISQYIRTEDENELDEALNTFLSFTADSIETPQQAVLLLRFACRIAGQGHRDQDVWTWAQQFREKFPKHAGVLSAFATLANVLRTGPTEELRDAIDVEEIEKLYRLAMTLAPDSVGAHVLAGEHFLFAQNYGEAERCLARAFRLDRTLSAAALQLAEVYQQTDRPRDALNVLDLCLREGCDDPHVAWDALVQSINAGQFDAALTYAHRFDELKPDDPGVNYYRAIAFLELGRFDEALQAAEAEMNHAPEETLHIDAVRGCALLKTGRTAEAEELLLNCLIQPCADLNFLTQHGISQSLDLIWRHTSDLSDDSELRSTAQKKLLATGLMPDSFFDQQRQAAEMQTVNFYQLLLEQPLDDSWPQSTGCLPGQKGWKNYRIVWGVLAPDEESAKQYALAWQNQCEAQPAHVVDIALDSENYEDHPGAVWQGMRWSEAEDEDLS